MKVNMKYVGLLGAVVFAAGCGLVARNRSNEATARHTDNRVIEGFVRAIDPQFKGSSGQWNFSVEQVEMTLITDQNADRMRIIAPVASAAELSRDALWQLLEADFDRALDAKYAVFRDAVWSTYVHPLGSLTREEFISAARQVAALRRTYGSTFTSTDLVFGGGTGREQ